LSTQHDAINCWLQHFALPIKRVAWAFHITMLHILFNLEGKKKSRRRVSKIAYW
jgi:hypothetical protein